MDEQYTVADLARLVDMPAEEISKIVFSGMVEPEVHRSNGSGDPSLFGVGNVSELVLIQRLQRLGVKRAVIKEIVTTLGKSGVGWWRSGGWLVVESGLKWWVTDNLFSAANIEALNDMAAYCIVRIDPGHEIQLQVSLKAKGDLW